MDSDHSPSKNAQKQIDQWEHFLNGTSNKQQLVSRYIYEHLFIAHIHFEGSHNREFYRLIRSRTPPGKLPDEIATNRPYHSPGDRPFFYRFQRHHPSIVVKNHVVYRLTSKKLKRFNQLFIEPEYQVDRLPPYDATIASNPFKVFASIPANSRYRFLLDDARFFIEGFIKGPVCRGQIALNVIEDQFWVFFTSPDRDITTHDPGFLDRMSSYLQLPADRENTLALFSIWTDYWKRQKQYMLAKETYFKAIHAKDINLAMDHIWDGNGTNPNAALTIFRHFDSASVMQGLVGDYPETAWIIDYPMFERIHYLLAAGFDVYGNVGHQLNTRLYMDFLRMEGENHFLALLPVSHRKEIRDSWYQGMRASLESQFKGPMDWLNVESVIGYHSDDPQTELYQHIIRYLDKIAGASDPNGAKLSGFCMSFFPL